MNQSRGWRHATWASLCVLGALGGCTPVCARRGVGARGRGDVDRQTAFGRRLLPRPDDAAPEDLAGRPRHRAGRSSAQHERSALAVIEPGPGQPHHAGRELHRFRHRPFRLGRERSPGLHLRQGRGRQAPRLQHRRPVDREARRLRGPAADPDALRAESRIDSRIITRALPFEWFLYDVPDDDSGEVVIGYGRYDARWDLKSVQLARLNVQTQQRRTLEAKSPDFAVNWELDPAGETWALQTLNENRQALYFKTADGAWTLAQEGDWVASPTVRPFASDGRDLRLVLARSPAGTQALYRIDPKTLKKEAEPLVSLQGFDFDGAAIFDADSRRLLGLHFESDAPSTHWFDATLKEMQTTVDQALPGRANTLECRRCLKTGRVMVTSMSTRSRRRTSSTTTAQEAAGVRLLAAVDPRRRHGAGGADPHLRARRTRVPGDGHDAARQGRRPEAGRGARAWRAFRARHVVGLERAAAVPRLARLRRDRAGVPRQRGLRRAAVQGRLEAMGRGDDRRRQRCARVGGQAGRGWMRAGSALRGRATAGTRR